MNNLTNEQIEKIVNETCQCFEDGSYKQKDIRIQDIAGNPIITIRIPGRLYHNLSVILFKKENMWYIEMTIGGYFSIIEDDRATVEESLSSRIDSIIANILNSSVDYALIYLRDRKNIEYK